MANIQLTFMGKSLEFCKKSRKQPPMRLCLSLWQGFLPKTSSLN